ncbi:hypothetical protein C368_05629 [Cryptococcus neoformans 125.91]|nr:hypothetical protein C368_05629 [Cryptococcus neoformans var. grubii 125.91]
MSACPSPKMPEAITQDGAVVVKISSIPSFIASFSRRLNLILQLETFTSLLLCTRRGRIPTLLAKSGGLLFGKVPWTSSSAAPGYS